MVHGRGRGAEGEGRGEEKRGLDLREEGGVRKREREKKEGEKGRLFCLAAKCTPSCKSL